MLPALPAIYDCYWILGELAQHRFSGSLAGKLLLRSGLDGDGLTTIAAASIAGVCSLCVEPDAERLREALRAGLCDFVVGPLDEALRILKNELRRGLSVSVGVTAEPNPALADMIDRGLQPDLVSLPPGEPLRTFVDRGALALPEHNTPDSSTALIEWSTADLARAMPQIDGIAAQSLEVDRSDTPLRQHWLEKAPRLLGRAFTGRHCVRMTTDESAAFAADARARFPEIQMMRDGTAL